MISKSQILSILKENFSIVSKTFYVSKIGLFGSFVKDAVTENSDIDILVDFSKPITIFAFIELEEFLTEEFGRKVDLVSVKGLKPIIKTNILREVVYV